MHGLAADLCSCQGDSELRHVYHHGNRLLATLGGACRYIIPGYLLNSWNMVRELRSIDGILSIVSVLCISRIVASHLVLAS